jgi:gliding motility-associated-like protein
MSNNTSTAIKEILDLTFPNVITPNGDGKNDTFKVLGLAAYSQSNMFIYNRWNSEVWRSTGRSYENDWNGDQLGEGTYFYIIKLKDRNGVEVVFKGWVMLLRD